MAQSNRSLLTETAETNQSSQAKITQTLALRSEASSDFRDAIKKGTIVDTSLLITEVIDDLSFLKVFIYPFQCGKSFNLSMLQHFFAPTVNGIETKALFQNLDISQYPNDMKKQGKQPVIYLDFSDFKANNEDEWRKAFSRKIAALYQQHTYVMEALDEHRQEDFNGVLNSKDRRPNASLKRLTAYVNEWAEKYDLPSPIILIDSYDKLLSYKKAPQDVQDDISSFFLYALKDNSMIKSSIVTGNINVPGILPNNYRERSNAEEYSKYFAPRIQAEQIKINPSPFIEALSKANFVDHSLLIREIIYDSTHIKTFIYPDQCGKSVNLSMLQHFFCATVNGKATKELFEKLEINHCSESMQHQGKQPIIYLDFSDFNAKDKSEWLDNLSKKIAALYQQHRYVLESINLTSRNKEVFNRHLNLDIKHLDSSLQYLTECVRKWAERNNLPKPIVLIDGPEKLLSYATADKEIGLEIRNFFWYAFKDNGKNIKSAVSMTNNANMTNYFPYSTNSFSGLEEHLKYFTPRNQNEEFSSSFAPTRPRF